MDNPLLSPELHTIAEGFLWNAERVLADSSPFYARLARRIADDPELLALVAHARSGQPVMNMLFGAVHYLLLQGTADPLALFFADLSAKPNTTDDPYPIFRAFCFAHREEILDLLRTRRVQTNEVARCALFLPVFTLIAQRVGAKPLAMIEVGSSAGLNLNWDRYGYDYGDGIVRGDATSPVLLKCELRGARAPLPKGERNGVRSLQYSSVYGTNAVSFPSGGDAQPIRVGIDLNPNDVFDADAMLWLRALVWPEQLERAERLEKAIALARLFPPKLEQGDALQLVPRLIQATPRETPIILFHSFVLNQVPARVRTDYYELLEANSTDRTLFDVAIEPMAWPAPLILTMVEHGTRRQETLATCDHHGRWLEWSRDANDDSI